MAIDYRLAFDTPGSGRRVAEVLRDAGRSDELLASSVTVDDLLAGFPTVRGTWIRVVDRASSRSFNSVEESFGFVPTVSVAFRQGHDHDYELQDDDMIRLVSALLDRVAGDAVLYFDTEDEVWLLRRHGELSVRENSDVWPEHRLALLTPPYRRATHRFR